MTFNAITGFLVLVSSLIVLGYLCWIDYKQTYEKSIFPFEPGVKDFFSHLRSRVKRPFSHGWYWLRTHTYNRYHLVDCRSPHNDYAWGWIDQDRKLLFAAFAILTYFVEEEKAFEGHIDWDATEQHRAAKAEILELYQWWKEGRAKEQAAAHALLDGARDDEPRLEKVEGEDLYRWLPATGETKAAYDRYAIEIARLDAEDDEMLARLIKVRHEMWV